MIFRKRLKTAGVNTNRIEWYFLIVHILKSSILFIIHIVQTIYITFIVKLFLYLTIVFNYILTALLWIKDRNKDLWEKSLIMISIHRDKFLFSVFQKFFWKSRLLGIPKDDKIVYNNFFGKLKFLLHLGFPWPNWPAKDPSLCSWSFAGQIGLGNPLYSKNSIISLQSSCK